MTLASDRPHVHKEAFCLMQYQCENCGEIQIFWNSRDGVTSFIVSCDHCPNCSLKEVAPGVGMKHVNWPQDKYAPDHIPEKGQWIFVDMPESLGPVVARYRLNAGKGTEWEVPEEDWDKWVEDIAKGMEHGSPWAIQW